VAPSIVILAITMIDAFERDGRRRTTLECAQLKSRTPGRLANGGSLLVTIVVITHRRIGCRSEPDIPIRVFGSSWSGPSTGIPQAVPIQNRILQNPVYTGDFRWLASCNTDRSLRAG
jgi:hypothetical protein